MKRFETPFQEEFNKSFVYIIIIIIIISLQTGFRQERLAGLWL